MNQKQKRKKPNQNLITLSVNVSYVPMIHLILSAKAFVIACAGCADKQRMCHEYFLCAQHVFCNRVSIYAFYYTHLESLKYSFKVVLNFLEYFTNSLLRCSTACLPDTPGMKEPISLTTSKSFFMALAISLKSTNKHTFRTLIKVVMKVRKFRKTSKN